LRLPIKIKKLNALACTNYGTYGAQIRGETKAFSKKEHQKHYCRNNDSGEPPRPGLHNKIEHGLGFNRYKFELICL
jgi:hypothetical protein